jgi:PKD repeat protein
MNRIFLILVLPFLWLSAQGQQHDNYWLLGLNSASGDTLFGEMTLHFDGNAPSVHATNRPMNFQETVCSMSDSLGKLLFYSNGTAIYAANDQLMENGHNISPGVYARTMSYMGMSFPQTVMAVPVPQKSEQYYLIHQRFGTNDNLSYCCFYGYNTLLYSKIDMLENNGIGSVVEKNKVVFGGENETVKFEWPTLTKSGNGADWWIVMPNEIDNNHTYHVFRATSDTILHWQSQILPVNPTYFQGDQGQNLFSPNGNIYVDLNMWPQNIKIFDFDRCTGTLMNQRFVSYYNELFSNTGNDYSSVSGGGAAISPNSRFLYICTQRTIYQYDLEADDIKASAVIVAEYDGYQAPYGSYFYLMQLGPDGRIYINSPNGETVMHVINRPNEKGLACDVRQHGLQLPRYNYRSMPHFPNYRLGPLDGSPCDTLGINNLPLALFRCEPVDSTDPYTIEFTDLSSYEPTQWDWAFGDGTGSGGNLSGDQNKVHTFPGPGSYEACLTVSNQYGADTYCKVVYIGVSATEGAAAADAFQVFPNPASGEVTVVLPPAWTDAGPGSAQLVDPMGRAVWQRPLPSGTKSLTQRFDGLAAGMYFVVVKDDSGNLHTKKLVLSQ